MTCNEPASIQLPVGAASAVWRVFGDGVDPFKQPTSQDLVEPIIRKQLGKTDTAEQAIAEIRGWFDPDGAPNQVRQGMDKPVAQLIIYGIGMALFDRSATENRDTAFWAMGSIRSDVAAPIVRSLWSSRQIDEFAGYALDTLEGIHGRGSIIDPKPIVGSGVRGATVHASETDANDLLRTFQVGPDTVYQAYRLMYPGIPQVVTLLLKLKPEMLPELVDRVPNRLLQSLAASCVAGIWGTSDYRQPLRWIAGSSSTALIALAILHTLEIVHQREIASRALTRYDAAETGDLADASDPIADMASSLAALEPARSTWWAFELLNHTSVGPDPKRPATEQVEQQCTQLLNANVLHHWSNEVAGEIKDGLRRARFEPRGKPLADIAWGMRDAEPDKASQISGIILEEHERRMAMAVADSGQFPYHAGRWNHQDWLQALAVAVVIHHKDIDPLDWAMEKCKTLPLSAWEADERGKIFRTADQVAQTQMTVGLYAVQLLTEAGRVLDCGKLRTFAENVWSHADFVRKCCDAIIDNSVVSELAARVVAAFGEPDQAWVLKQANTPSVDPQTLWALLSQMKLQDNSAADDNTLTEIRKIASDRYINVAEVNPRSAPHLANLWVLLDAPEQAAKTAQVLLTYQPSLTDRAHAIPALKMLAFAESRGELAVDLVQASRSLYDNLWGNHTRPDEMQAKEEIDTFFGCTKSVSSESS